MLMVLYVIIVCVHHSARINRFEIQGYSGG